MHLILDNLRDYAFIGTDAEGRITDWEAGAQSILGWSANEAIGQPSDMIFLPEDRAAGVPRSEMARARDRPRGGPALAPAPRRPPLFRRRGDDPAARRRHAARLCKKSCATPPPSAWPPTASPSAKRRWAPVPNASRCCSSPRAKASSGSMRRRAAPS
ncbi:PAS domain-containing protein [Massilia sp. Se16.2.3]|uniref:PAS domain-containing protein n=1 Tax=Massilia sp. Se16.2.3 TaxID=2709303 RepID=UPI0035A5DAC4